MHGATGNGMAKFEPLQRGTLIALVNQGSGHVRRFLA